ncbi:5-aminolevulic acid synthase [Thalassobacter stenotrophicus]|uniref:5-aminolevulic acid synthase n=1 Tax=Thalassobacter stenotrophicus TaxID=266809 RepID=UPI0022A9CA50|nr:5-aminolevulic acid synthase [Thalassobacter stenotrophicus]UYP69242.1 5-aminolevulic acid synthase [Thalassobacter stenotrophicus]
MRKMIAWTLVGGLTLGGAMPAAATDTVPGAKEAWRMLFGTRASVAEVSTTIPLSQSDRDIVQSIGPTQQYYGAIAYSPDEGLLSEATVAAANHHSVEVARGLALADCNGKRREGAAACVVAADILPKRYRAGRALQLSMGATAGFDTEYRKARGSRSFAISAESGLWGWGPDDAAALQACNAQDCKVVVRD